MPAFTRSKKTSTQLKIAFVGLAAIDTWLSGRQGPGAHRARFLTKPLLMPTLAASLATDPRAVNSPLRTPTLAAQVGGWGGDVALLGEGTKPFITGAASFAVGHAAYLHGFFHHRDASPIAASPGPRAVAVAWAVSAPVLAAMAGRRQRELGLPVLGYSTFLAAMTAGAHHLDRDLPASARRLTAAGATLFMVSDTLLAIRKFVFSEPPAALETGVMATYTTAQFLLSEGAARA